MKEYLLYTPAEPAEHCYLREALYWRSFGRLPREEFDGEGGLFRFCPELLDSINPPIPTIEELEDDECEYAGLSPDPRMAYLLSDRLLSDPADIEQWIEFASSVDEPDESYIKTLRQNLLDAQEYQRQTEQWLPLLGEYLDQFQNEILLDLRRGHLTAMGTRLPVTTESQAVEWIKEAGDCLADLPMDTVPKEFWISQWVDWEKSAIFSREACIIWIHLPVESLIERYPPELLINPEKTFRIGASVAILGRQPQGATPATRRGRPSLPWEDFHVEVARLYMTDGMPAKKEAAIALLQEWFTQSTNKSVSRSAVGQKLKPYFDKLGRN